MFSSVRLTNSSTSKIHSGRFRFDIPPKNIPHGRYNFDTSQSAYPPHGPQQNLDQPRNENRTCSRGRIGATSIWKRTATIRPREQVLFSFRGWSRFCWGCRCERSCWGCCAGRTRVRNYGYVVFFLPMDGGTYTVERQTKTYVPKYESTSPKKHLWTRPKRVRYIKLASFSIFEIDASF